MSQRSPSVRPNNWRNSWSREILPACTRIYSTFCLPFKLTYNYSVFLAVGSILLEKVLSPIRPLLVPHRHLQPYHCLRPHPPNHQLRRVQGNGFQSYVFMCPTAKGLRTLFVQAVLASPAASRSMAVAVGSEGTGLPTLNLSVHFLFFHLLPNRQQPPYPQFLRSILHSRMTALLSSYDRMTQCVDCVTNVLLRQLRNVKRLLVKPSWRPKKRQNSKRPFPGQWKVLRVVPLRQPHLFPTCRQHHKQLQPLPWEDYRLHA